MMMEPETKDTDTGGGRSEASGWENRRLCRDESCIGVIGPDGRCKECGKPYEEDPAVQEPESAPIAEDNPPSASPGADEADASEDEWERRQLCRDESCIGVIGPDGRCKECGKPYSG